MRIATRASIVMAGVVSLVGSALAEDMTGSQIKEYLAGKTVYAQTTGASSSGQAGAIVIYLGEDGTEHQRTPSGTIMHGTWRIEGNTLCTQWNEKPAVGCARFDTTGDTVTVIDAASGKTRATIVKTAAGNAEKLTP